MRAARLAEAETLILLLVECFPYMKPEATHKETWLDVLRTCGPAKSLETAEKLFAYYEKYWPEKLKDLKRK